MLVKNKYLTSKEVKYLSFDNKINLHPDDNNVYFTVNMPGVAPATGNLVIDQLKVASTSATTTSVAQKEAQALDNKTIGLNDLGASETQKAVLYENTKTIDKATTAALQSTILHTVWANPQIPGTRLTDVTFDSETLLLNKAVKVNFYAQDSSGAKVAGTFNVIVKPPLNVPTEVSQNQLNIINQLDKLFGSYKSSKTPMKMDATLAFKASSPSLNQKINTTMMTWLNGAHPVNRNNAAALQAWQQNGLSTKDWSDVEYSWQGSLSSASNEPTAIDVKIDDHSGYGPLDWGTFYGYTIPASTENASYEGALLHRVVNNGSVGKPLYQGTYDLSQANQTINFSNTSKMYRDPTFAPDQIFRYESTVGGKTGLYLNQGTKASKLRNQIINDLHQYSSAEGGSDIWSNIYNTSLQKNGYVQFMYAGGTDPNTQASGVLVPGQEVKVAMGTTSPLRKSYVEWTTLDLII